MQNFISPHFKPGQDLSTWKHEHKTNIDEKVLAQTVSIKPKPEYVNSIALTTHFWALVFKIFLHS
jgi:hypothetical protein